MIINWAILINRQQRSFKQSAVDQYHSGWIVLSECLQGLFYLSSCTCRISAACHSSVEGVSYFAISFGMAINSLLLAVIVLIDPAFELAPEIYSDMPLCSKSSLISIKYRSTTGANFSHSHYNLFQFSTYQWRKNGHTHTHTQHNGDCCFKTNLGKKPKQT